MNKRSPVQRRAATGLVPADQVRSRTPPSASETSCFLEVLCLVRAFAGPLGDAKDLWV